MTLHKPSVEERLCRLEKTLTEIIDIVSRSHGTRLEIKGVDMFAYQMAIKELARGNVKPLETYMKRGGKIPVNRDEIKKMNSKKGGD